jgi:hypothetical protein
MSDSDEANEHDVFDWASSLRIELGILDQVQADSTGARTCRQNAVAAIDEMFKLLHPLRNELVAENRKQSDAFMAALDEKYGPATPNG